MKFWTLTRALSVSLAQGLKLKLEVHVLTLALKEEQRQTQILRQQLSVLDAAAREMGDSLHQ
jgi:hypothetical protein